MVSNITPEWLFEALSHVVPTMTLLPAPSSKAALPSGFHPRADWTNLNAVHADA